jgi:hypothetical protein
MHHQRNAHRFKAAARQLRAMRRGRGGHGIAVNVGKIDARLFKDAAVTQHAAAPAATGFALPVIFLKFTAVNGASFWQISSCSCSKNFYLLSIGFH